MASRSQPSRPLDAGDDPLRLELELRPRARCLNLTGRDGGLPTLARLLGLPEELAPTLRCPQLLGQLIAARLAIQLILGLVGRLVLGEDVPRDLANSRLASRLAFPDRRVPSIATTPGFTNPARSHSPSTSPNNSANTVSCRTTNLAIVA